MLPQLHQWMADRALRRSGFSRSSRHLISRASRWPDVFRWDHCPSQAATPSNNIGVPIEPEQAAQDCSNQLKEYLARISGSPLSEAYVWLGFALHLVQDLAVHQGRTYPDHSTGLFFPWANPDISPKGHWRGWRYSLRLVNNLKSRFKPTDWANFKSGSSARQLTKSEREQMLGQPDRTTLSIIRFARSGWLYLRLKHPHKKVRWDTKQVLQNGLYGL